MEQKLVLLEKWFVSMSHCFSYFLEDRCILLQSILTRSKQWRYLLRVCLPWAFSSVGTAQNWYFSRATSSLVTFRIAYEITSYKVWFPPRNTRNSKERRRPSFVLPLNSYSESTWTHSMHMNFHKHCMMKIMITNKCMTEELQRPFQKAGPSLLKAWNSARWNVNKNTPRTSIAPKFKILPSPPSLIDLNTNKWIVST